MAKGNKYNARIPNKDKISKVCGKCYKNDLLDKAKFNRRDLVTKIYEHDLCTECYPIIATEIVNNPRYKSRFINNKYIIKI